MLLDGFTIQDGGYGIHADSASLSIRNCVITDNYAGGISMCNGTRVSMQVANCVLANNTADTGGAIYVNSSSLLTEIVNCTIAGNSAASNGGGIANGSPMIIENSIIWDNNVGANPSNVYNYNNLAAPMISYSDIEGSIVNDIWQSSFGNDCGNNIADDPCFINPSDPNGSDGKLGTTDDGLALDANSSCINAGENSFIHEANDIAGNRRRIDGDGDSIRTVDMGAYEFFMFTGEPVHFSGIWVADGRLFGGDSPSSIAFEDDWFSDILEPDYYPNAYEALIRANYESFDSIAVHQGTRVQIWDTPNCAGNLVLDVSGPAIIYNAYWKGDERYNPIMTADFSETGHSDLQAEFPPSVRYWSDDERVHPEGPGEMYNEDNAYEGGFWGKGSIKIEAPHGYDCEELGGGYWEVMYPETGCPYFFDYLCLFDHETLLEDNFGNTLKITCNKEDCAYKYWYKDLHNDPVLIGKCVWKSPVQNIFKYKRPLNEFLILATEHYTCNEDEGVDSWGEGCEGYFCIRKTTYCVDSNAPIIDWIRTRVTGPCPCLVGTPGNAQYEPCPGHWGLPSVGGEPCP